MSSPIPLAAERIISGEEFRQWRNTCGMTIGKVAANFGIPRVSAQRLDYVGLTRTQALAIAAIMAGLEPWSPQATEPQTTISTSRNATA